MGVGVSKPKFLKESIFCMKLNLNFEGVVRGGGALVNPNTFFDGGIGIFILGTMQFTVLLKSKLPPSFAH